MVTTLNPEYKACWIVDPSTGLMAMHKLGSFVQYCVLAPSLSLLLHSPCCKTARNGQWFDIGGLFALPELPEMGSGLILPL